jgi:hypothetical protein
MREFVFLIKGECHTGLPPEEYQKQAAKFAAWIYGLIQNGHLVSSRPLGANGRRVTANNITDGPFIESKEDIGGYFLIRAKDLDEATLIAKGCPALESGGIVEVRAVDEEKVSRLREKLGPEFK